MELMLSVNTLFAAEVFWGSCLADLVSNDTIGHEEAAEQRIKKTLQRELRVPTMNCEWAGYKPPRLDDLNK